jgi:hypothetical protein
VGWGKRYLYPLLALLLLAVLLPIQYGYEACAQADGWIRKVDTPQAGGYGEAVVGTGNYVYVARCLYASSTPCFWGYDPATDSWESMSISGLPTGAFRSGTALAWDHGDHIYALLGARYADDDRRLFYCYEISSNSWEQLSNTPYEQGAGDAAAWSGYDGYIYAILGSNEHGTAFGRYDISEDSWERLPLNPSWTVTDDGASLAWTGGEYLYALRGEWEELTPHGDFARYHIPTRTWHDMSLLPDAGGVGDGASLLWVGSWMAECSDYIFALGGGAVDESPGYNFYRYSISDDSWQQLESIPCPVGYYVGNRLGFADGRIYYWQGSPTTSSWICGGKAFYVFEALRPTMYYLRVISDYGDPQGEGWYDSGSIAAFSVTSPVGTAAMRHVFTNWSGDSAATTPAANILMGGSKTVIANWRTEYYLTVVSDYGDPQGEGWYDSGSVATFCLTSPVGTIVRHFFTGWSSDSTATTPTATVLMDEPKAVVAN